MNKLAALLFVLGCFAQANAPPASEVVPNATNASANAAIKARIQRLESNFRCLVCQNETIADSTADLAADLRAIIHEQVEQGATDAQIRDYMVTRYGDFVLYDPPFRPLTFALWIGPFVLLVFGFAVLVVVVLRRRRTAPAALTDLERRRARRLLGGRL
jgi:cytochrome c-type biogenesis protein CcmH